MATTTKQPPPKGQAQQQSAPPPEQRAAPADRNAQQAANQITEFDRWLHGKADQLAKWCVNGSITPDALIRFALITFRREPKFHPKEVWPSIYLALLTAAQLGLEPSGPLGEGWIVPRYDKKLRMPIAQWQTGYRGYITLMVRSGTAKRVRAFSVFEADEFRIRQGSDPGVIHQIFTGPAEDRGEVIGAYAVAWLPSGEQEYEWVPRVDIDKAREMAAEHSGAWEGWFDQMARRLPIKRLANQLPVSPRLRQAIAIENAESQEAIKNVLEGSAGSEDQVKVLPASQSTAWPTSSSSSRKDALKSRLRKDTPPPVERAAQPPADDPQPEEDDVPDFNVRDEDDGIPFGRD